MKNGLRLAFLTAIVSGVSVFVNSLIASRVSDPLVFVTTRNILVAVIYSAVVLTRIPRIIGALSIRDIKLLLVVALVGGGLPFALFFMGLSAVGAAAGNLINKTAFFWVGLFAFIFLGERLIVRKWFSYALLAGSLALVLPWASWSNRGAVMVLVATVLWSLEYVISKKVLSTVQPDIVSWFRITFGLPVLFFIVFVIQKIPPAAVTAGLTDPKVIVSALFLTGYMALWYRALACASASAVSIFLTLAPVVTILLDIAVRQKSPDLALAVQGVLGIAALIFVLLSKRTVSHEIRP